MADLTTEQKLARFFNECWGVFIQGGSLDGMELQDVLEKSGLTEWRACTAEQAAIFDCDMEEGDLALFLTDEGKQLIAAARATYST